MKITHVEPLPGFQVRVQFDDGTDGTIDLSHFAGRGVFQAWQQPGVFDQVKVTPVGALEWPGEVDLCPDALYLQATGKSPEEMFPALRSLVSHA